MPVEVAWTWASTNAGRDQPALELDDGVDAVHEPVGRVLRTEPADRVAVDDHRGRSGRGVGEHVAVAVERLRHGRHPALEHPADARLGAEEVHCEAGVPGHEAVADQHRDIGGQALGAERRCGERRRHREEDDRAALGGGQDGAVLAAGHVDADDGDVGAAPEPLLDGGGQRDRVAGVGERDLVGETCGLQRGRLCLDRDDAEGATCSRAPGRSQRHRAALARSADDGDGRRRTPGDVGLDDSGGQRRCAAHVVHRHRQLVGKVTGQDRRDGPAEQDCGTLRGHLLGAAVPAREPVGDRQRGEAQRHQAGDPVADREPEGRLRPDLVDDADQHPARTRDRVLHLAALRDDREHLRPDRLAVAGVRVSSWRKDAASRLSRSTRTRTSSGQISGDASRRAAA